ncbi:MAG: recombinase RecA [Patescibacteria group bacterium]|nr:recombinase RecA [Patescibacteria group bacterium]MDE2438018.1 recombinase RecA [Patescibacteria group bacterium]
MKKQKEEKKEKEDKGGLQAIIDELREKFGEGAIMTLGEAEKVDVRAIPTGSLSLDLALGVMGVPHGRIIEIYGPESSGKTTLALHIVAEAQKKGGKAAFIDAEHALDPEYARRIGVKLHELLIAQPDNGEEALNILEALVRSGDIDVCVVDSVAALTPKAEIEGEMGQQYIGLQARLMSQALRKLTAITAKSDTIIIFINQIRSQIGTVMFGNPETTPGGRALKFYASVRLDVRRIAQIKRGDDIIGNHVRVKVAKNKVAPPFKVAEFDIFFNKGIVPETELLNLALKYGIATKSGASYSYNGERLGVGMDAASEALKENQKVRKEVLEKVKAAWKDQNKF